jgi:hypothetical protein
MSTQSKVERDVLYTVEVHDPNGQRTVFLEGLRSSTTVAEIRARAMSELRLTDQVDWNLRHDGTGRLLQESQHLGEFVDLAEQVVLTMQPDAGLG